MILIFLQKWGIILPVMKMKELFDNRIETENTVFRHANGKSIESGKEFHIFHEIIYFIDGDAEFLGENIHVGIKPNTLIVIPKETYHRLIIHGDREKYHRCVINLYDSPALAGLIGRCMMCQTVLPSDLEITRLFDKLIGYTGREDAGVYLGAVTVLLLDAIAEKCRSDVGKTHRNTTLDRALEYINANIGKKMSIEEIAKECTVSESALSHLFRKEFNITIHKFIVKKKLINAYNRIHAGVPSTVAAMECGFNDYSGFYKQYRKAFGESPSKTSSKPASRGVK